MAGKLTISGECMPGGPVEVDIPDPVPEPTRAQVRAALRTKITREHSVGHHLTKRTFELTAPEVGLLLLALDRYDMFEALGGGFAGGVARGGAGGGGGTTSGGSGSPGRGGFGGQGGAGGQGGRGWP